MAMTRSPSIMTTEGSLFFTSGWYSLGSLSIGLEMLPSTIAKGFPLKTTSLNNVKPV